jgi:lipoprotein NlpI
MKKQESDKAIEDCSQAIRLKPDIAQAFNHRGGSYTHEDQYDRAIEDYNEAPTMLRTWSCHNSSAARTSRS